MTRGELLERAAASTFEVMFKGYTLGQCECGSEHCDEYKCECACPGCPNLVAEWTRTAEAGLRTSLEAAAEMVLEKVPHWRKVCKNPSERDLACMVTAECAARIRRAITAAPGEEL